MNEEWQHMFGSGDAEAGQLVKKDNRAGVALDRDTGNLVAPCNAALSELLNTKRQEFATMWARQENTRLFSIKNCAL